VGWLAVLVVIAFFAVEIEGREDTVALGESQELGQALSDELDKQNEIMLSAIHGRVLPQAGSSGGVGRLRKELKSLKKKQVNLRESNKKLEARLKVCSATTALGAGESSKLKSEIKSESSKLKSEIKSEDTKEMSLEAKFGKLQDENAQCQKKSTELLVLNEKALAHFRTQIVSAREEARQSIEALHTQIKELIAAKASGSGCSGFSRAETVKKTVKKTAKKMRKKQIRKEGKEAKQIKKEGKEAKQMMQEPNAPIAKGKLNKAVVMAQTKNAIKLARKAEKLAESIEMDVEDHVNDMKIKVAKAAAAADATALRNLHEQATKSVKKNADIEANKARAEVEVTKTTISKANTDISLLKSKTGFRIQDATDKIEQGQILMTQLAKELAFPPSRSEDATETKLRKQKMKQLEKTTFILSLAEAQLAAATSSKPGVESVIPVVVAANAKKKVNAMVASEMDKIRQNKANELAAPALSAIRQYREMATKALATGQTVKTRNSLRDMWEDAKVLRAAARRNLEEKGLLVPPELEKPLTQSPGIEPFIDDVAETEVGSLKSQAVAYVAARKARIDARESFLNHSLPVPETLRLGALDLVGFDIITKLNTLKEKRQQLRSRYVKEGLRVPKILTKGTLRKEIPFVDSPAYRAVRDIQLSIDVSKKLKTAKDLRVAARAKLNAEGESIPDYLQAGAMDSMRDKAAFRIKEIKLEIMYARKRLADHDLSIPAELRSGYLEKMVSIPKDVVIEMADASKAFLTKAEKLSETEEARRKARDALNAEGRPIPPELMPGTMLTAREDLAATLDKLKTDRKAARDQLESRGAAIPPFLRDGALQGKLPTLEPSPIITAKKTTAMLVSTAELLSNAEAIRERTREALFAEGKAIPSWLKADKLNVVRDKVHAFNDIVTAQREAAREKLVEAGQPIPPELQPGTLATILPLVKDTPLSSAIKSEKQVLHAGEAVETATKLRKEARKALEKEGLPVPQELMPEAFDETMDMFGNSVQKLKQKREEVRTDMAKIGVAVPASLVDGTLDAKLTAVSPSSKKVVAAEANAALDKQAEEAINRAGKIADSQVAMVEARRLREIARTALESKGLPVPKELKNGGVDEIQAQIELQKDTNKLEREKIRSDFAAIGKDTPSELQPGVGDKKIQEKMKVFSKNTVDFPMYPNVVGGL